MVIDLRNLQGDHLARAEIPNVVEGQEPKVVVWGTRVFVWADPGMYREMPAYWARDLRVLDDISSADTKPD